MAPLTGLLLYVVNLLSSTHARTLAADPAYTTTYTLSSGDVLLLERSITYGDIAVVTGIGILIVVIIIYALIRIPRLWLH